MLPALRVLAAAASLAAPHAAAQTPVACTDPNSLPDGGSLSHRLELSHRFAGPLAMAELVCGASGLDWQATFERFAAEDGCGPGSPVSFWIVRSAEKVREKYEERLTVGGSLGLSGSEVATLSQRLREGMGGCATVLETYAIVEAQNVARATPEANRTPGDDGR